MTRGADKTGSAGKQSRRGLMLVLSSPSGAGKSTIAGRLLEGDDNLVLSVSATSRKPRPGEEHGREYFFLTEKEFTEQVEQGVFLEHAVVFDHHYGTPRAAVEENLAAGRDVLFDIDWQGTLQLRQTMHDDLVTVFILPPSAAILRERLMRRAQDPAEVVAKRMQKAASEMAQYDLYDYVVINDDLEEALEHVRWLLAEERLMQEFHEAGQPRRVHKEPQFMGGAGPGVLLFTFVNDLIDDCDRLDDC